MEDILMASKISDTASDGSKSKCDLANEQ